MKQHEECLEPQYCDCDCKTCTDARNVLYYKELEEKLDELKMTEYVSSNNGKA